MNRQMEITGVSILVKNKTDNKVYHVGVSQKRLFDFLKEIQAESGGKLPVSQPVDGLDIIDFKEEAAC